MGAAVRAAGVPRLHLVFTAAAVGVLAAALHAIYDRGGGVTDIDVILYAARDVVAGVTPYAGVGPDREWSFYYPLIAALPFIPFSWLSSTAFHFVLLIGASGLLAWGVARDRPEILPLFFSAAFLQSALHVQWPPILMVAVFFPALAWLYVLKPHSGLALLAAYPTVRSVRAAALGGAVLFAASLLVQPSWPAEWLASISGTTHFKAAVLHPGGVLLLLALLRWRRPEARLLLVLALIPRTAALYEMLFLFLIPRTRRETWALVVGSWVLLGWHLYVLRAFPDAGPAAFSRLELGALLTMYLPALGMVLRRPNVGEAPEWARSAWDRASELCSGLRTRSRPA